MTAVGRRLPDLERRITLTDMVAYAGATWDWHRMHYDQEYTREKQLPAPVVDGQVFGALLVAQLQDHFGPDSFVQELSFRFAGLVFAGESVRCESTVSAVEGTRVEIDCRVVAIAADGHERPAVAPASAVVRLPAAEAEGS